jgi:hypothetical protein
MSQVQLEAFFLVQNACTAFPSTLVSMLELSPPLPILLLLSVAGLSGLNTIIVIEGAGRPATLIDCMRTPFMKWEQGDMESTAFVISGLCMVIEVELPHCHLESKRLSPYDMFSWR